MSEFDFVVLGGGSAGYAAARTAHELGLSVAVVDGADELGGLCILRGCMPSKTLIQSANRALSIRRAGEFGLRAHGFEVHPEEIRDRKRELIDDFAGYRQGQLADGRFELIRGYGQYLSPTQIIVNQREGGERIIEAKTSIIATGSKVSEVPIEGLAELGYWTSDDILDTDTLPQSIIVLGGGAIALEMAHYLEGVGRDVFVIQRSDQLLSGSDRDVAKALEGALNEREKMDVFTATKIVRAESADGGLKKLVFEHKGELCEIVAEEILYALGREPATAKLDLVQANIETDRGYVKTQPDQQTSQPNIFAAGDVCGPLEVVHIAIEQGEAAAYNAARYLGKVDGRIKTMDYRLKLFGVFTEPQVAQVGMTENEAIDKGVETVVATYPFDDHGKSMTMGETHGFVKLIGDKHTGEILGGSVVGPEATELIHEIVVAMHFHAKAADLMTIPHYHPTLSEIWTYPAEDIADLVEEAK